MNRFFASAPRGVEPLLAAELSALGATDVQERIGGAHFSGELACAYRVCLWSRLASRVLLPVAEFDLTDTDQLYAAAQAVAWEDLFDARSSFAIESAGRSAAVTHSHYASLKVKDAIADRFREKAGRRPDVDTEAPDIRVHLHLGGERGTLSLDLAGDSLHRRGYRLAGGGAPMKENLAAAILVRAGWPEIATRGGALIDPVCGSGTLVLEAALIAADIAPALGRERFGFEALHEHRPALWRELKQEADERKQRGLDTTLPPLHGQDSDDRAVRMAHDNARSAGLDGRVVFRQGDVSDARPIGEAPGLVVANPPYGERLGDEAELIKLYSLLGATLKTHFGGWRAAVFTGRPDLGPRLGLRAGSMHSLYNGPIACKLLNIEVPAATSPKATGDAAEFANRLAKNVKHLAKWARRREVSCYRLYDADLKTYALAIDLYQSRELHACVQEYAPPKTVDPVQAERRLREALNAIQRALDLPASRIHYRLRRQQKGSSQYEKQSETGSFHEITEHGVKLLVNFDDYLDTGLFLDHRPMRLRLQQEARGKRFLNLFCYTGAATAHAAVGGAVSSVSLDLSNTYLEWAGRNLRLNDVQPSRHELLRADCREWLADHRSAPLFDLIFCDPPTFSTSKRMEGTLDLQRDHAQLIRDCAKLLTKDGVLYFSTNRQGFKLDDGLSDTLSIKNITAQTLDEDFKRPPPAHRSFRITAQPK